MNKPKGFLFNGVASGIKKSGRKDLALIFSEKPAVAAAVFTKNIVKGAPIIIGKKRIRKGLCQSLLINSGVANTYTGEEGIRHAEETTKYLAKQIGIKEDLIIPSSTGIIGGTLPVDKIKRAIPKLVAGLSSNKIEDVARAIMTTDRFPKVSQKTLTLGGKRGTITAIAKGAGMIAPNMATMLCFVLTDFQIEGTFLKNSLREVVNSTFNRIIVDGDTSTNDSVFILANGFAGNRPLDTNNKESKKFTKALNEVCDEVAYMMVKDGEGATKVVKILVEEASSEKEAEKVARTVGTSILVKTAFFGEDPNWGRLVAAAGRAGVKFNPKSLEIYFDRIKVVSNGIQYTKESKYAHIMKKPHFTITLNLNKGTSSFYVLTSDLTFDYVKLNSHYRT